MVINMGPILRGEITRMEIEYDLAPEPVLDVTFPQNASRYISIALRHCPLKFIVGVNLIMFVSFPALLYTCSDFIMLYRSVATCRAAKLKKKKARQETKPREH